MNAGERFDAPWSMLLKVTSCLGAALLAATPFICLAAAPPLPAPLYGIILLAPLAVLVPTALLTVRGYAVTERELLIQRLAWQTHISLDGLQSVETDPEAMKRSIRLCGNGGLFAFSGWFRSKKLGTYRAFTTDPKRSVVLRWLEKVIVVTPEEPELFTNAVRAARRMGPTRHERV